MITPNIPVEVLLIVILGIGLYLQDSVIKFRVRFQHREWSYRAAMASFMGTITIASYYSLIHAVQSLLPCNVISIINTLTPQAHLKFTYDFLLLLLFITVIKTILNYGEKVKLATKSILQYGSPLDRLFLESLKESRLIKFTSKSSLIFIGWVIELPDIYLKEKSIIIIPVFTGLINEANGNIKLSKSYLTQYAEDIKSGKVEKTETRMILNLEEIVSTEFFDIENSEFADKTESSSQSTRPDRPEVFED